MPVKPNFQTTDEGPPETMRARATKTRRKTRIQLEKEAVILDAALDLFSAKGFAGTKVDQIAAASGMSKPNLLYYFKRKEDIYSALLERQLDDWIDPLLAIDPDGDPIEELRAYIRRKLKLSQTRPRESRLYANEILQGGPNLCEALHNGMPKIVDDKARVIQDWIDAGKLRPVEPKHLIFAIWSTTQHYADFDVQVRAILGTDDDSHYDSALKTLETLFLDGLRM